MIYTPHMPLRRSATSSAAQQGHGRRVENIPHDSKAASIRAKASVNTSIDSRSSAHNPHNLTRFVAQPECMHCPVDAAVGIVAKAEARRHGYCNIEVIETSANRDHLVGDRTFELSSGITSEPGRCVKSLGDSVTGNSALDWVID